ncbi:phage baseplate assembly protein V [Avibacterium paragallinarum]|uniref:phage baseplate assembly protein V n=1 Tax=Avibacterium paragallinarum TaxID=728 RepID=UPI00397A4AB3
MSAETNRRIENLIRYGVIAEVDCAARRVRVQSGEILTDWLPWCAFRAGTTKIWSPVTVGEQCVIFAPSGELSTGFVLAGIYCLEFDTPSNSPDKHVIEFADGAKIEYNQASSALKISGIHTALVQASTSVTLETPVVKCTKNLEVAENVLIGGNLAMSGSAGGGNAEIKGNVKVQGNVKSQADIVAGSVSLKNHTHTGDSGGTTGKPNG